MYLRPNSLSEAVSLLASAGGQILAGGTDFYPALGERTPPDDVLDISGVCELRGITISEQHARIGGLTTWTDVIRAPLPRCFDALKAAAREIGSVQIQNRGTVAGNLCNASPAADGVPPLLVLDASIELTSTSGTREMPLAAFITGNRKTLRRPDEILSAVIIPLNLENAASAFVKLGARRYLVISISMVAAVAQVDTQANGNRRIVDARIAVGSCSAKAQRLTELERALADRDLRDVGSILNPEHVASLSPIDDIRATAIYRRDASLTLVRRALEACLENC